MVNLGIFQLTLDVGHSNKFFKDNFKLGLEGEWFHKVLMWLSKSQDIVSDILDKYLDTLCLVSFTKRHSANEEKYREDVQKLVNHLVPILPYSVTNPKHIYSAIVRKSTDDVLMSMDMIKLRLWLVERFTFMKDQPFYKY